MLEYVEKNEEPCLGKCNNAHCVAWLVNERWLSWFCFFFIYCFFPILSRFIPPILDLIKEKQTYIDSVKTLFDAIILRT